ncbi:MAG: transglycosylase family protein [Acidimicrobiia bacterium]
MATELRDVPIGARGPGRAEPHDETAWLPLPEVEDLPAIQDLLDPTSDPSAPAPTAPAALRDIPAEPSPARAAPAEATSWLPLPDPGDLPEITELVDPDRGAGASPPPPSPRRQTRHHFPRRAVARLLVLTLVVVTLGGLYYGGSQLLDEGADVAIKVDGTTLRTETGVSSVASVLKEAKVALGEWDRVVPAPTAPIQDGMTVKVVRAFALNANFDGKDRTLYSTYTTPTGFVQDAARQLSLPVSKIALIEPPATLTADATVRVRTKREGTLLVDGSAANYNAPAQTVGELLEIYKVVLGPADILRLTISDKVVTAGADLPDDETVEVTRVAGTTVQVEEPYELEPETRPDENLPVGETRVEEAVTGTQLSTYALEMHDGREVSRTRISAVPQTPAHPHIDFYGTKYNPLWDKMARCETGGNWQASGQNYQGGLGIYFQNWNHYGGLRFAPTAGQATKLQQIIVAERIRAEHGWRAWGCAKRIGL